METSRSTLELMRRAYALGQRVWPDYDSPFSRHDFTRPQLFACLAVRESLRLSYRKAEAFLIDVPDWLAAIGLDRAPDHNTLWRGFGSLLKGRRVGRALDLLADDAAAELAAGLCAKPRAYDGTCYEERHRSRHYDRVCRKMDLKSGQKYAEKPGKWGRSVNAARSAKLRRMPKLALAVAAASHRILAARASIGNGSDAPDFEPLLFHSWRRAKVKKVVADAGYDSEDNHRLARLDMGVRSVRSAEDRPAFQVAAVGVLSSFDEISLQTQSRREAVWSTVAERNDQQHDETQPGRKPAFDPPGASEAGNDAPGHHAQPHARTDQKRGSRLSQ